jgi:hypothetical protein
MWRQVVSLFVRTGDVGALARRAGLVVAGIGLAWTLLIGGIGLALWGTVSLLSRVMPVATAAVIIGGTAAVLAAAGLLWRRRTGAGTAVPLSRHLLQRYPLESVVGAAALGYLVGHSDDVQRLLVSAVLRQVGKA